MIMSWYIRDIPIVLIITITNFSVSLPADVYQRINNFCKGAHEKNFKILFSETESCHAN